MIPKSGFRVWGLRFGAQGSHIPQEGVLSLGSLYPVHRLQLPKKWVLGSVYPIVVKPRNLIFIFPIVT